MGRVDFERGWRVDVTLSSNVNAPRMEQVHVTCTSNLDWDGWRVVDSSLNPSWIFGDIQAIICRNRRTGGHANLGHAQLDRERQDEKQRFVKCAARAETRGSAEKWEGDPTAPCKVKCH